jgi:hypothetical protein
MGKGLIALIISIIFTRKGIETLGPENEAAKRNVSIKKHPPKGECFPT